MARPVTKGNLLWGYGAQALNIGAGILLLPAILHYLSPADIGLWFVFITLANLSQLLEFGFQPTLTRNVAYVFSGAQSLSKVGLPPISENGRSININLLRNLIASSRKIYRIISLWAAILLLLAGTAYITTLLTPDQDTSTILLAWITFSMGHILTFYFGYFNGILQGRGDVTQANKVVFITRAALVILGSVMTVLRCGLLGLGISSMLAAVVGRIVVMHFFTRDRVSQDAFKKIKTVEDFPDLVGTLWHNASRLGVVQVGAFFIQRGNVLIASSFLGTELAATYGMTVMLFMVLSSTAGVICQVQIPHWISLQIHGDRRQMASLYWKTLFTSFIIFLLSFAVLVFLGNNLLILIGSKVRLLPMDLVVLYALITLLEMNHVLAATYLTTMNHVPFVRAAIISGAAVFIMALLLIKLFGILGLILAQGVVQMAYNNWKWPWVVYQSLKNK